MAQIFELPDVDDDHTIRQSLMLPSWFLRQRIEQFRALHKYLSAFYMNIDTSAVVVAAVVELAVVAAAANSAFG